MKYCAGLLEILRLSSRILESLVIGVGIKMKYCVGLLEILRLSGRILESAYW